ncbi:MAG: DUF4912 domain-containing protein [Candidatus Avelusimicrobium sp.]|uniref:DUF4912 domain-containing protein n=1 Tax=Candidatus Avelusimicrobium sp. TaxID=3048833 RepID=UPI003F070429
MTQNLSSSALVRPQVKDANAEADIPSGYGKTESFLLPKDPAWLFLFWEITQSTLDCVKSQYGQETLEKARTVIRLHDVTGVEFFDGTNSVRFYDMPVIFEARSWYINAPESGRTYLADLGYLTEDGRFILITRSNITSVPSGRISNVVDDKWMIVEGDFQKLLQLSGADYIGLGSSERMQVLGERWKLTELTNSGAPSSWSSFKLHLDSVKTEEDEDIWLKADCEIIIYGSASKNAIVTINGQEIELKEGKFSIRQHLPAGSVVDLPIKARNAKGDKTRQVTIKALREQGK